MRLLNVAFPHLMRRGLARPLARSTLARFASNNSEEGTNTEVEDEGDNARSSNILREDQLYPWQRDIFEMVTQYSPHERLIHWYHDDGNSGKSALAKMLVANHGAMMMDGRSVDIKHSIHNFHEEHASYPKIIIFNLPRSAGNSLDFVGLEHVKDGTSRRPSTAEGSTRFRRLTRSCLPTKRRTRGSLRWIGGGLSTWTSRSMLTRSCCKSSRPSANASR